MDNQTSIPTKARRFAPAGIIGAALGLLLFAYFVRRTGINEIVAGVRRLGAGFLLIMFISGLRPMVRALAWTRCFEAPHTLRWRDALRAYLEGDALGNLMPLGIVVSEPAKAAFVRDRVPLGVSFAALAIENLFYMLSVVLFIFTGAAALLFSFAPSAKLRLISIGILVGIAAGLVFAYFVFRRQWRFLSKALEFFYGRGIARQLLEPRRARVSAFEDRLYGFYARQQTRLLPILLLEVCFHLAGVVEIYATLYFISDTAPTWLTAFILVL